MEGWGIFREDLDYIYYKRITVFKSTITVWLFS